MTGPETATEAGTAASKPLDAPPGHFLSEELASDCARFLAEAKALARRRAGIEPRLEARAERRGDR